jgi:hypothetical protein
MNPANLAWAVPLGLVVLSVAALWALNWRDRRRLAKQRQPPADGEPLTPGERLDFIRLTSSFYDEPAP